MSRKCAQIFRRAEQQRDRVHAPIVCFFELAMLLERGRVKSSLLFADWHDRVAQFPALPIEPLVWEDVREARGLAVLVDPFDRLIAGTPRGCGGYRLNRKLSGGPCDDSSRWKSSD